MANYYGYVRTNYFGVTDKDKLEEIISQIGTPNSGEIEIWESNGKYAFGVCDSIDGLPIPPDEDCNDEDDNDAPEYNFDLLCFALQGILIEGDAVIITEVGHEKLNYLVGNVTVITCDDIRHETLMIQGVMTAREMLGNDRWTTQNDY